jgi:hypothetical protein
VCSAAATTLRSRSLLSVSSGGRNRRGSGGRHGVRGGDALVTDIHDAFRPSMQSAGGSRQVQLANGEERAKAAQAKAKRLTARVRKAETAELHSSLHSVDSSLNVPLETWYAEVVLCAGSTVLQGTACLYRVSASARSASPSARLTRALGCDTRMMLKRRRDNDRTGTRRITDTLPLHSRRPKHTNNFDSKRGDKHTNTSGVDQCARSLSV